MFWPAPVVHESAAVLPHMQSGTEAEHTLEPVLSVSTDMPTLLFTPCPNPLLQSQQLTPTSHRTAPMTTVERTEADAVTVSRDSREPAVPDHPLALMLPTTPQAPLFVSPVRPQLSNCDVTPIPAVSTHSPATQTRNPLLAHGGSDPLTADWDVMGPLLSPVYSEPEDGMDDFTYSPPAMSPVDEQHTPVQNVAAAAAAPATLLPTTAVSFQPVQQQHGHNSQHVTAPIVSRATAPALPATPSQPRPTVSTYQQQLPLPSYAPTSPMASPPQSTALAPVYGSLNLRLLAMADQQKQQNSLASLHVRRRNTTVTGEGKAEDSDSADATQFADGVDAASETAQNWLQQVLTRQNAPFTSMIQQCLCGAIAPLDSLRSHYGKSRKSGSNAALCGGDKQRRFRPDWDTVHSLTGMSLRGYMEAGRYREGRAWAQLCHLQQTDEERRARECITTPGRRPHAASTSAQVDRAALGVSGSLSPLHATTTSFSVDIPQSKPPRPSFSVAPTPSHVTVAVRSTKPPINSKKRSRSAPPSPPSSSAYSAPSESDSSDVSFDVRAAPTPKRRRRPEPVVSRSPHALHTPSAAGLDIPIPTAPVYDPVPPSKPDTKAVSSRPPSTGLRMRSLSCDLVGPSNRSVNSSGTSSVLGSHRSTRHSARSDSPVPAYVDWTSHPCLCLWWPIICTALGRTECTYNTLVAHNPAVSSWTAAVRADLSKRGLSSGTVDKFTPSVAYIRVLVDPTFEADGGCKQRSEIDARRLQKEHGYSSLSTEYWTAAATFVESMRTGTWELPLADGADEVEHDLE